LFFATLRYNFYSQTVFFKHELMFFARLGYNIGIYAYNLAVWVAAFFLPKARLWRTGRENWREKLAAQMQKIKPQMRTLWFHCASLGEFEQARSLIASYRQTDEVYFIVVSFFSPSGYQVRQNYALADVVCYLPLDTPRNAADFIALVRPDISFFIRYEFWYNYLSILHRQGRKLYLISAIFTPKSLPFRPVLGILHRQMLRFYSQIFVQDPDSAQLLAQKLQIRAVTAGDTRIDAIIQNRQKAEPLPQILQDWAKEQKVFVCASVYLSELPFLLALSRDLLAQGWQVLIVPHDVAPTKIKTFAQAFADFSPALWSAANAQIINSPLLIIDTIGLLQRLYSLSQAAYIGGALGGGNLHNILEAAVYRMPTFFGTSRRKFTEADALVLARAAFLIPICRRPKEQQQAAATVVAQLLAALQIAENQAIQNALNTFFDQHSGATEKVKAHILAD
jgi:3-deoxy-D-manno-octulosonic-acid transferase